MAFDENLAERVRSVLLGRAGISERKMMGGLCFMAHGNMCCGVTGSALMVRVGRDAYTETLTRPHVRSLEFGGRRPGGFVLVDPKGCRTDAALRTWVERGLDVAGALPEKKQAATKPRLKTRQS